MLEGLVTLVAILCALIVIIFQNNIIRLFVIAFISYFYIGWLFARNMTYQQLMFYNSCIFLLLGGIVLASLMIRECHGIKHIHSELHILGDDVVKFNPLTLFMLVAILITGLVSYVVLVVTHGVPVLNISARDEVSGFFTYLIGLIWVSYPFLFVSLKKGYLLSATVLVCLVLVTMGYRTPLVIVLMMFLILNFKYQRFIFSLKAKIFSGFLLLSILTIYPLLRFQEDPEAVVRLLGNLDLPPELFLFAPFVLVFAEGASVVLGISQIFPDVGAQWGAFTYSGFSTILPGEQEHSRTVLSFWLGRKNWDQSTTTSTIIGQFYLEGGRDFVYLMCFLLGAYLKFGADKFLFRSDIFQGAAFLVIFIFLTLAIHTGLLDPIILYVLLVYGFTYIGNEIGEVLFTKK